MPKVFVSGVCTFTKQSKVVGFAPSKQREQHFAEIITVKEIPSNSEALTLIKVHIGTILDAPSWTDKIDVQIYCLNILS